MNKEQTNNEKLSQDEGKNKCYHCREMLYAFVTKKPDIRTISFVEIEGKDGVLKRNGHISFSLFRSEMGFDKATYLKYEKEFWTIFMVDFFGEFLVRENIGKFVELVGEMDSEDFLNAISSKIHKKFGMEISGNVVTFTFHMSLIPKILSEDLKDIGW